MTNKVIAVVAFFSLLIVAIIVFVLNSSDSSNENPLLMEEKNIKQITIVNLEKDQNRFINVFLPAIKDIFEKNKEMLNKNNCSGVLMDIDKDGFFDDNFLRTRIAISDENKDMVIHYNLCSILWSTKPNFSFIVSDQKLISDKKFEEIVNGKLFVPAIVLKTDLAFGILGAEAGYVPKEDILK